MKDRPIAQIPCTVYRLQFNRHFTFRDATKIIGYLHDLGITDIYASPYFAAKKGSLHGYDIVDHNSFNPEIGAEEDYHVMTAELQRHGMGQVLDIVPNHMCVACPENVWWMDVLENGPGSLYAAFFDIDWEPAKKELKDKILIPVLGDQYGIVLESGDLKLFFEEGAFFVRYFEHRFPLRPETYVVILEQDLEGLKRLLPEEGPDFVEYLSISTALRHLPPYTETAPEKIEERHREKEVIKRRLGALLAGNSSVRVHVGKTVEHFNGTKGDPRSFDLLDHLLGDQVYRLSYWQVATEEINYRRFFDVNALGAVRTDSPAVFRETHKLLFKLIQEGTVTGLRVDHPDGLYNPVEYFHRLQRGCFIRRMIAPGQGVDVPPEKEREAAQEYDEAVLADPTYKPFYIVGEKILTRSERMPGDWPIFGTTGYVYLNSVNGIFIESENARAFDAIYEKFVGSKINMQDVVYEKKKLVMQVAMSSEVNTLAHYLNDLSERNRHTRDFTLNSLRNAIVEVIACFPVYRTYTNTWQVSDPDRQYIELAVSRARRRNPAQSGSIFDFLKDVLLLRFPKGYKDEDKAAWLDFAMRFQQVTGPVMAKGVEDTAFYVYNRLVSLNEVGGAPERFGTPPDTFHGQNIERAKSWPHALITTSTHDTKRGEDVRARLNVLSEIPREWAERVRAWARLNKKKKTVIEGFEAPDRNEEYLLYQTLVGAWPPGDVQGTAYDGFVQRMKEFMLKASREAKVNTSWINPDAKYEDALLAFIEAVLVPMKKNRFLDDFLPFQHMVSRYGMFNSLSQTLLKIASPGVPDFYQGAELWDFSLVDPDNRKLVDFGKRIRMLAELKQRETETAAGLVRELTLKGKEGDGMIKQFLIAKTLHYRKANRVLFEQGEYVPLSAAGEKSGHVFSFMRSLGSASIIVAVPRFLTRLVDRGSVSNGPFGKEVWGKTYLVLPGAGKGATYRNVITGEVVGVEPQQKEELGLALSCLFASFPVALLEKGV